MEKSIEKSIEKLTKKSGLTHKKLKQERVLNYMMELKANPENILEECDRLIIKINSEKTGNNNNNNINELLEQYEAILNVIEDEGLNIHTTPQSKLFKYYPDYSNRDFNDLIFNKKEFYLHRGEKINIEDEESLESTSKKMCDPLYDSITGSKISDKSRVMFNLTNSQKFLKTFMSPHTPYNSLLVYHGTGVGKTCTSIAIAEQYIEELSKAGKKVIIILNQSIKENFIKNIFNAQKLKKDMPYYQCTGESYLKHIPDYKNMSTEDVQKKILKLIKSRYEFFGYQKFANMINLLESKIKERFSEQLAPKIFEKKIKEMFSNNVLIIDEAHNIKEGDSVKVLPPILEKVVKIADNMKLLLLTATPMFDNATEIIWLVNILRMNQKRPTLKIEDFFDNGRLIPDKILVFKEKIKGLISYVRGENPLRFPAGIYPKGKGIMTPDKLPRKTIDGEDIHNEDQIKELVLVNCPMSGLQSDVYNKMITSDTQFGSFKQPGIMCSNIVFPTKNIASRETNSKSASSHSNSNSDGNKTPDEFVLNDYIGDSGFNQVAEREKDGERVIYTINPKKNIFLEENLHNFSAKIARLVENIKNSEGIVFIYSQFINSGVVPIALALEHAGYSKYGGSLLKRETRPNLGKYIIISGSKDLSKNAYKNYLKIENENKDGKRIKIIIGSETASEGLDFRFIRSIHIFEPWFHLNKIDQVVGRGIRNCSHIDLPPEKRNVTIYYYCSTNPSAKQNESLDISIYREAEMKSRNMAEVEYVIKTSAVDCEINRNNNQFFTDKDYSRRCNYKKCDFKCDGISKGEYNENSLNYDTINQHVLNDSIDDVIKILKYGNNKSLRLFSTNNYFTLEEIITYVDMDLLVTLLGLNKLIIGKDSITDKYGRICKLKYKNGMYVLVPDSIEHSLFTSDDLRVVPYKRTKKMEIKGDKIKEYLSGKASISIDEFGRVKYRVTKTIKRPIQKVAINKTQKANNNSGSGNRSGNSSVEKLDPKPKIQSCDKLLKTYENAYNKIMRDITENSSQRYLDKVLESNSSKIIFEEDELQEMFREVPFYWVDHLDPNRKKIICEVLILKHYNNSLTNQETELMNYLYNILTLNDVYYKDISFKGNKKAIWGYKLATFEKTLEYYSFNNESKTFQPASEEERQAIQKSFLKKQSDKGAGGKLVNAEFLEPNNLIGFIELKLPQKEMEFKIRDKSTEKKDKSGKIKGTQVKTGSICNNDGMKKPNVIKFIFKLRNVADVLPSDGVDKRGLPNKDLLCLQLETYFKYFDKIKRDDKRYFYNYEESIEFKLTKKN